MAISLIKGDCLVAMRDVLSDSLDACVTDPPYGLSFMDKNWDHGVPGIPFWLEVYRVLKPGAHIVAFGGTRTYHRMACAIEDAGFEIRDSLMWVYGVGFISFAEEDVTEVRSHDHDVLQCLDVVLGAMNFRLTRKHKDKQPGQTRRSAKTLAKLRVYNYINKRVREIYPNFNIGITTGHGGDYANRWKHPYRHWNFRSQGKPANTKGPIRATPAVEAEGDSQVGT